ncbi:uncharacterized protein M421DRAFT_413946 [Didymella exigua CBS 183.55]|uniref:Uncharacterized protein n=1 Tax=Didymella exigua CBS 183.55 TaxID=1150837 RepID=A0A6A5RUL7_9PLEO|nr:uncharacterized protein M421DRAFT_413946 [Didymella exigua CBS 183.55]KAF1929996.1 hypothetical protein M421DRAFT_413946 [Didymella exigua CBS 183.55]
MTGGTPAACLHGLSINANGIMRAITRGCVSRLIFLSVFRVFYERLSTGDDSSDLAAKIKVSGVCLEFQTDNSSRRKCTYKYSKVFEQPSIIFMSNKTGDAQGMTSPNPTDLPRSDMDGLIPVNATGQRLDVYLPPPNQSQWGRYTNRRRVKKICNAFHLQKACSDVSPAGNAAVTVSNETNTVAGEVASSSGWPRNATSGGGIGYVPGFGNIVYDLIDF